MATKVTTKRNTKYQDGGTTVTRKDIQNAKRTAKLKRIEAGTEPSTYEKVANITGNVAKTAAGVAETAKAVSDARRPASSPTGPGMKRGGTTPKLQKAMYGKAMMQKGGSKKELSVKEGVKLMMRDSPAHKLYKGVGKEAKSLDDKLEKKYPNWTGKGTVYSGVKKGIKYLLGYKTGGMVNPNSKVSKQTVPGSRGVKSGTNPKAAASKVARGRVGGTSAAPKTAMPKAQRGGSSYTPPNQPGGTPRAGGYTPRSNYTPGNQPGGTPRAGGYVSGNGLSKPAKKSKVKSDFKTMMRNASKKG